MKTLRPIPNFEFYEDVMRIVTVCANAGYRVAPDDAALIWEAYSESMAAGWMMLDEDDEILLNRVLAYSEADDE